MKLKTTTKAKAEQYLIEGIATNNSSIINKIYKNYSKPIWNFVLRNNGTLEDAKDIFQEGILAIYQTTQKRELVLTSSFFTYLYAICQKLWWKKLSKAKRFPVILSLDKKTMEHTILGYQEAVEEIDEEQYKLYLNRFEELPEKKQQLLKLYFEGCNMREVAQIMNLKNEAYARKLKYKSKLRLKQLILRDNRFQELVA